MSARDPALIAAAAIAFGCVLAATTYRLYDTDFWQHLAVGRAFWTHHVVPTRQLWRWPSYGAPDANSSWGFSVLLWPFWAAGGVTGLFVWRWLSGLAVFGLGWATARRLGARGLAPLLVVVVAALAYRTRSQARPETLAAVLLALEIWILEVYRQGGRDLRWWLVPIACVWANSHITWFLFFFVLGAHLLPWGRRRTPGGPPTWRFALIAAAACLLNPAGARMLARPFEYVLTWRGEALFRSIQELRPLSWRAHLAEGLPFLAAGWPLLAGVRWMREGFDPVEGALCAAFTATLFGSERMLSPYAVAAVPYAGRALDALLRSWRGPRWTALPWARAGAVAAPCAIVTAVALAHALPGAEGVGLAPATSPVAACDFMSANGVRGRGLNYFPYGGYMLHRFWPDRDRLPFVGIHPEDAPPDERRLYWSAFTEPGAWRDLDRRFRFDYVLWNRQDWPIVDFLDADTTWALVFMDDAASLFVRRSGPLAAVAARKAYAEVPAGRVRFEQRLRPWTVDPVARGVAREELRREVSESPENANAHLALGDMFMGESMFDDAAQHFGAAIKANPWRHGLHDQLGVAELARGNAKAALVQFGAEQRLARDRLRLDQHMGQAWQALGDLRQAERCYRRELGHDPDNAEAAALLRSLQVGAEKR